MYRVRDTLPIEQLQPGSYLLAGPPMTGKYDLLLDLLAEGITHGEGALGVTTQKHATTLRADLEARLGTTPVNLLLIDCAADHEPDPDANLDPDTVESVGSPGDLTGIGIAATKHLRRFTGQDTDKIRAGLISLDTLLMYSDVETVFRFLHVLTGKLESVNAIGFFVIDPTAHEDRTVNTLKQLFDGMVELRDPDQENHLRLLGVPNTTTDWVPPP